VNARLVSTEILLQETVSLALKTVCHVWEELSMTVLKDVKETQYHQSTQTIMFVYSHVNVQSELLELTVN
jgi:hypothetical protein